MEWIKLTDQRPPIGEMGQTDHILVIYLYKGEGTPVRLLAFYDQAGKGTGWRQSGTFREIPEPLYWMPLPDLPDELIP